MEFIKINPKDTVPSQTIKDKSKKTKHQLKTIELLLIYLGYIFDYSLVNQVHYLMLNVHEQVTPGQQHNHTTND